MQGSDAIDVLVVDDSHAVRTSWGVILRDAGWVVEEAGDGLSALEVLRACPVGVIVLDVRMQLLDGFGLLDRLDDPPPVVLVSARSYDTEVMARRGKIHSFIRKPVPPDALRAAVREAMEASGSPNAPPGRGTGLQ